MKVYEYTYKLIDSKMYLIVENGRALVIDPFVSEKIFGGFLGLKIEKILLTHEHYDHISGVNWLKEKYSCEVICSERCGSNLTSALKNGSKYFSALFIDKDINIRNIANRIKPMVCEADVTFNNEYEILWEKHHILMKETPGHSEGSICILVDNKMIFTGDSLLKDIPVVTRLMGGDKKDYNNNTLPYLQSLSKDLYVYPGHGEGGALREFQLI